MVIPRSSHPFDGALGESFIRLARGRPEQLASFLHDVEVNHTLAGTRVTCHCHSLKLDGNGRPRVRDLVRVVCDNVLDFAIPRSRIAEAQREYDESGSTAKLMRLRTEALQLFTDLSQTGEGGELLLFVLAEQLLRLPQLLCKMDLKTNARMHVHGADGLHAGVDEQTRRLVLYWGESKIYSNPSNAIRECFKSLAPMLRDDSNGGSPADRDFQLLQRYVDLNSPELEAAFQQFLDPENPHFNSLEFRGLGLVGFGCEAYPQEPGKLDLDSIVKIISESLPKWKSLIKARMQAEKLDDFGFHFICVPFPSAEDFRIRLRQELGIENKDDIQARTSRKKVVKPKVSKALQKRSEK